MKTPALVLILVLTGCASAPPASPPPAAGAAATPTPSSEEEGKIALRKQLELITALSGKTLPPEGEEEVAVQWEVFKDPATGKMLQRIPKSKAFVAVGGRLGNVVLGGTTDFSIPIVREDAEAYYVEAPPAIVAQASAPAPVLATSDSPPPDLVRVFAPPKGEADVVTPAKSSRKLRLEEMSAGFPTSGLWRSNSAVADLDGDGKPEVITTSPRLSPGPPRIFRFDGSRWSLAEAQFRDDERVGHSYGGVAVADLDGDGKLDLVYIGHGRGPAIAFNEGGFRFRIEKRGLPRELGGRAVAIGDLNDDGKLDIVAVSDDPEAYNVNMKPDLTAEGTPKPLESGYVPGYDTRAFLASPSGNYVESRSGLDGACFGYTLGLVTKASDGGKPFVISGCRYQALTQVLHEYDPATNTFSRAALGVVEQFAFHSGTAVGRYGGKPAAVVSYVKASPIGAGENFSGHGVSVYYRERGEWKRKRVVKTVQAGVESQGLAMGDLDGDGLDDVVWGDDSLGKLRVFFQTPAGEFEELDRTLEPAYPNHSMSVQIADFDGDGRKDIVLMYEFRSADRTRAGGLRYFRNVK